ncbi:hypothetical protein MTO96_015446 [Rhipicephalus appendiculatus]
MQFRITGNSITAEQTRKRGLNHSPGRRRPSTTVGGGRGHVWHNRGTSGSRTLKPVTEIWGEALPGEKHCCQPRLRESERQRIFAGLNCCTQFGVNFGFDVPSAMKTMRS